MTEYYKIIDAYTHYKNGSHHYVSIPLLDFIIHKLKECKEIPNIISFNPFFEHKDFMFEVEERILYIESRKKVNKSDIKLFFEDLKCEEQLLNCDMEKRYFLIQKNDIEGYKKALDGVVLYLNDLIPYIIKRLQTEYKLTEPEFLFGNISFEIYCE